MLSTLQSAVIGVKSARYRSRRNDAKACSTHLIFHLVPFSMKAGHTIDSTYLLILIQLMNMMKMMIITPSCTKLRTIPCVDLIGLQRARINCTPTSSRHTLSLSLCETKVLSFCTIFQSNLYYGFEVRTYESSSSLKYVL